MTKLSRHHERWFIHRIGHEIIKGHLTLFSVPIKILSTGQAKALFLSQETGVRYQEISQP